MIDFEARVSGLKELDKAISKLQPKFQRRVYRNAVNASLLPVMREAKASAPRGTEPHKTYKGRWVSPGFLARSVARKTIAKRDGSKFIGMVGVKPEAFYGTLFLELGTSQIPARPWLEPAFRRNKKTTQRLFRKKLWEQIRKQIRKQAASR